MAEKNYLHIAQALKNSNYFISAVGHRGVGQDELADIVKIIFEVDSLNITEALDSFYKYHPQTIALKKDWIKSNCNMFSENCDCFMPDINFEECYCRQLRKGRLLEHDRRNYKEYFEWRSEVFKRDNYTCRDCGQVGGRLNAHHIKGYKKYPELRVVVNNGLTLCEECHRKRHKRRSKT